MWLSRRKSRNEGRELKTTWLLDGRWWRASIARLLRVANRAALHARHEGVYKDEDSEESRDDSGGVINDSRVITNHVYARHVASAIVDITINITVSINSGTIIAQLLARLRARRVAIYHEDVMTKNNTRRTTRESVAYNMRNRRPYKPRNADINPHMDTRKKTHPLDISNSGVRCAKSTVSVTPSSSNAGAYVRPYTPSDTSAPEEKRRISAVVRWTAAAKSSRLGSMRFAMPIYIYIYICKFKCALVDEDEYEDECVLVCTQAMKRSVEEEYEYTHTFQTHVYVYMCVQRKGRRRAERLYGVIIATTQSSSAR